MAATFFRSGRTPHRLWRSVMGSVALLLPVAAVGQATPPSEWNLRTSGEYFLEDTFGAGANFVLNDRYRVVPDITVAIGSPPVFAWPDAAEGTLSAALPVQVSGGAEYALHWRAAGADLLTPSGERLPPLGAPGPWPPGVAAWGASLSAGEADIWRPVPVEGATMFLGERVPPAGLTLAFRAATGKTDVSLLPFSASVSLTLAAW